MSDEYSDETYAAWTRFAAAVRDQSRDWLVINMRNELQCLADYQRAMQNMTGAQAMRLYYNPRPPSYSMFGGLFGSLI